jgi:hypothetical protein
MKYSIIEAAHAFVASHYTSDMLSSVRLFDEAVMERDLETAIEIFEGMGGNDFMESVLAEQSWIGPDQLNVPPLEPGVDEPRPDIRSDPPGFWRRAFRNWKTNQQRRTIWDLNNSVESGDNMMDEQGTMTGMAAGSKWAYHGSPTVAAHSYTVDPKSGIAVRIIPYDPDGGPNTLDSHEYFPSVPIDPDDPWGGAGWGPAPRPPLPPRRTHGSRGKLVGDSIESGDEMMEAPGDPSWGDWGPPGTVEPKGGWPKKPKKPPVFVGRDHEGKPVYTEDDVDEQSGPPRTPPAPRNIPGTRSGAPRPLPGKPRWNEWGSPPAAGPPFNPGGSWDWDAS